MTLHFACFKLLACAFPCLAWPVWLYIPPAACSFLRAHRAWSLQPPTSFKLACSLAPDASRWQLAFLQTKIYFARKAFSARFVGFRDVSGGILHIFRLIGQGF